MACREEICCRAEPPPPADAPQEPPPIPPICEAPVIRFSPPAGKAVNHPSILFIHSTNVDDTIYYGIDEYPTTLYTGPVALSDGQTLYARSVSAVGCDSALASTIYSDDPDLDFVFLCDGPFDKAGVFGEFAPNGVDDYHWRIVFSPSGDWTLHSVIIYETDAMGVWVTGQVWSTISPVSPVEIAPSTYASYPLVLFNGVAQVNTAYGDPITDYSGAQTLDAYGQPFVPMTGYFRVEMTVDTGAGIKTLYKIISHDCPPCPAVAAPDLSASCDGTITIEGEVEVGSTYKLFFATDPPCGDGTTFAEVLSSIAVEPTFTAYHSGRTLGCPYKYYISVYCTATSTWVDSTATGVTVPPEEDCLPPEVCPEGLPADIQLDYPVTYDFFCQGSTFVPDPGVEVEGLLHSSTPGSCVWSGFINSETLFTNPFYYSVACSLNPGLDWTLTIVARAGDGSSVTLWQGTKPTGQTPSGDYTKTSSVCPSSPGTLSVG